MPSAGRLAFRLFRKKPVRSSTQTSLTASAAVPDSGFAFVNNLQGASAALSEFSGAVSAALEHIDLEDDSEGSPFRAQLKLLENATGEYSNSVTDSCCELLDWECDKATVELIAAAFKCAAAVYQTDPKIPNTIDSDPLPSTVTEVHRKPQLPGITFKELDYAYPSAGGSSKAIGFWIVEAEDGGANFNLPALIVAVRGTERFMDNVVNANGAPVASAGFLGTDRHVFLQSFGSELSVHSGFLNGAKALAPLVQRHVSMIIKESRIKQIAFAGHSAGGGVAALLHLKSLLELDSSDHDVKYSCLTFGAPPVLGADVTEVISSEPSLERNRGINMAFVNEFDMICRVDQPYFRSLIDLFRSIYGLKPVMSTDDALNGSRADTPTTAATNSETLQASEDRIWPLPPAEYHIYGNVVLLRKEHDAKAGAKKKAAKQLRAFTVRTRDFERLLYCGIGTHSRTFYNERVDLILAGKFNYLDGWLQ